MGRGGNSERSHSDKPKTRPRVNTAAYTDEQKIAALTALITTNPEHPYSDQSLDAAESILGTRPSKQTISQWLKQYQSEVRALIPKRSHQEIVTETYNEVISKWGLVERRYLEHLTDDLTVGMSTARDAVIAAGTARDKIDKFRGLSPEILLEIQAILRACEAGGLDPKDILQDMRKHVVNYVGQLTRLSSDEPILEITATDNQSSEPIKQDEQTIEEP